MYRLLFFQLTFFFLLLFKINHYNWKLKFIINYYKIKIILIILIIINMFEQLLRTFSRLISTYSIFYLLILKHILSKI